jgi:hypothetical protein
MMITTLRTWDEMTAFLLARVQNGRGLTPDEVYDFYQRMCAVDPFSTGGTPAEDPCRDILQDLVDSLASSIPERSEAGTEADDTRACLDALHDCLTDCGGDLRVPFRLLARLQELKDPGPPDEP